MAWNESNAARVKSLIRDTDFLSEVEVDMPKITGDNFEHRVISASEFEGARKIIARILYLAEPKKEQNQSTSPYVDTGKLDVR